MSITRHIQRKKKIRQGNSKEFYSSGKIKVSSEYNENELNGKTISYFKNGNIRAEYWFDNGKVDKEKSRCFDEEGKLIPYIHYQILPVFPGWQEALKNYLQKLKYPEAAQKKKIEGRVIVRFVVKRDGAIDDIKYRPISRPGSDASGKIDAQVDSRITVRIAGKCVIHTSYQL